MSKNNYSIDNKAGTLTYWHDRDTEERETISLDELIEMLVWLKSRENLLRNLAYERSPYRIEQKMHRVGDYYVGVTDDSYKVKIPAELYESTVAQEIQTYREVWARNANERRAPWVGGYRLTRYDRDGKEIPEPEIVPYTPEQAPPDEIYAIEDRYKRAQTWYMHPANKDIQQRVKIS